MTLLPALLPSSCPSLWALLLGGFQELPGPRSAPSSHCPDKQLGVMTVPPEAPLFPEQLLEWNVGGTRW